MIFDACRYSSPSISLKAFRLPSFALRRSFFCASSAFFLSVMGRRASLAARAARAQARKESLRNWILSHRGKVAPWSAGEEQRRPPDRARREPMLAVLTIC